MAFPKKHGYASLNIQCVYLGDRWRKPAEALALSDLAHLSTDVRGAQGMQTDKSRIIFRVGIWAGGVERDSGVGQYNDCGGGAFCLKKTGLEV